VIVISCLKKGEPNIERIEAFWSRTSMQHLAFMVKALDLEVDDILREDARVESEECEQP
jgi:hypothetical protein